MAIARMPLAALAVAITPVLALAAPLDKEACDKLKADQATMTQAKDHLAKGPDWGKANLSAEQLIAVQRYIEVEEQIAFRCVQRKTPEQAVAKAPRPKPKAARAQAEAEGAEQDAPKKPVPKKRQAATAGGTGDEVVQKPAAAPARKAAPAAKPKANDAYSPPAAKSDD